MKNELTFNQIIILEDEINEVIERKNNLIDESTTEMIADFNARISELKIVCRLLGYTVVINEQNGNRAVLVKTR